MNRPVGPPQRRSLPGLASRGKPPTTPIEVLSVTRDGVSHHVEKQLHAACVSGIDTWTIETSCGVRLVVSQLAEKNKQVSCTVCLSRMDPLTRPLL